MVTSHRLSYHQGDSILYNCHPDILTQLWQNVLTYETFSQLSEEEKSFLLTFLPDIDRDEKGLQHLFNYNSGMDECLRFYSHMLAQGQFRMKNREWIQNRRENSWGQDYQWKVSLHFIILIPKNQKIFEEKPQLSRDVLIVV